MMIEGLQILDHIRTCQNQVFKASMDGDLVALRLTDPGHRSTESLQVEIELLNDLERVAHCAITVRSFPSGRFIESVRHDDHQYNAVAFPWIAGEHAKVTSFEAASRFGEMLAELHGAFEVLDEGRDLPVMQDVPHPHRIIHGDFNTSNVLQTVDSFVVVDFENACYSNYEFELANSLYMQLFDYRHTPDDLIEMDFARGFLTGYSRRMQYASEQVRGAIDKRVSTLAGWLGDLSTAPLAISTALKEWRDELMDFVHAFEAGRFEAYLDGVSAVGE